MTGRDHLENCTVEDCSECDHALEFFTACDNCGDWMNNQESVSPGAYYDQKSGNAYCRICEPLAKAQS